MNKTVQDMNDAVEGAVNRTVERVTRLYSKHERLADGAVHVLGVLFAINASLWLLWHVTGLSVLVSVSVYCLGLLAMTGFSAAYNLMPSYRPSKKILRRFDHAAIFIMIAATYTPLAVNRLGGASGDIILAIIWAAATFGVVMKVLFPRRFEMASLVLYILMGWLVVTVIQPAQDLLRRTIGRHQIVGRRKAGHRQKAQAIDRDADQHRQTGDVPEQPQAGVDGENDAGHMDDPIGQPFVLRIKPGDAFDGAVHRVFDGAVHVFESLVHGLIINTECGVTMNTARQSCTFLRIAIYALRRQNAG